MVLEVVGSEYLADAWPHCVYWLTLGSAGADYNSDDLRRFVMSGQAYLLVARTDGDKLTGAAVAEVHDTPKRRVLHVMAMGGRGVCHPQMGEMLRRIGADYFKADVVRCWAQPGQARLYRQRCGMKDKATVMEMECV